MLYKIAAKFIFYHFLIYVVITIFLISCWLKPYLISYFNLNHYKNHFLRILPFIFLVFIPFDSNTKREILFQQVNLFTVMNLRKILNYFSQTCLLVFHKQSSNYHRIICIQVLFIRRLKWILILIWSKTTTFALFWLWARLIDHRLSMFQIVLVLHLKFCLFWPQ